MRIHVPPRVREALVAAKRARARADLASQSTTLLGTVRASFFGARAVLFELEAFRRVYDEARVHRAVVLSSLDSDIRQNLHRFVRHACEVLDL